QQDRAVFAFSYCLRDEKLPQTAAACSTFRNRLLTERSGRSCSQRDKNSVRRWDKKRGVVCVSFFFCLLFNLLQSCPRRHNLFLYQSNPCTTDRVGALWLVNAQHIKAVPGRKTDTK